MCGINSYDLPSIYIPICAIRSSTLQIFRNGERDSCWQNYPNRTRISIGVAISIATADMRSNNIRIKSQFFCYLLQRFAQIEKCFSILLSLNISLLVQSFSEMCAPLVPRLFTPTSKIRRWPAR